MCYMYNIPSAEYVFPETQNANADDDAAAAIQPLSRYDNRLCV